jgi:dimethylargininase
MRALLQTVSDAYVDATTTYADPSGGIDVDRAREQHAGVVQAMAWLGYETTVLPGEDAGPDAVFVEDPAVISEGRALMTRSAHPVRAREGARLRPTLAAWGLELVEMREGFLDGGDVMIVGRTAFVGMTARTDAAGAAALQAAFPQLDVRTVAMPPGVLHLKCETSPLDDRVLATERMGRALGVPFVGVPQPEAYAANAVAWGSRVLCAAGFPRTQEALEAAGFACRAVDVSEMRKGDGSITCLSLRVAAR